MLTYMEVIVYYTLPPTIFLYFLLRPLTGSFDKFRHISICVLMLIYTAPWINYTMHRHSLKYHKDTVITTVDELPIERYIFFIMQMIFTSLWTSLCSRWTFSALYLKSTNRIQFHLIRYSVITLMVAAMYFGWKHSISGNKTFYLGSMVWWFLLAAIILWRFSGPYIWKRYKEYLASIFLPSIYFCYVDLIAMRNGHWQINKATSLGVFPICNDLPLEEIAFIFLTNSLVVQLSLAYDKSKAIVDTYYRKPFPIGSNISTKMRIYSYIAALRKGLTCSELELDSTVIDDIVTCISIRKSSPDLPVLGIYCFPNGTFYFIIIHKFT